MTDQEMDEIFKKHSDKLKIMLDSLDVGVLTRFQKYFIYFLLSLMCFVFMVLGITKKIIFLQWRYIHHEFIVIKLMDNGIRQLLKF